MLDRLSEAGYCYAGAVADFDRASGRLERASGAISASAAGLDPWEWLKFGVSTDLLHHAGR